MHFFLLRTLTVFSCKFHGKEFYFTDRPKRCSCLVIWFKQRVTSLVIANCMHIFGSVPRDCLNLYGNVNPLPTIKLSLIKNKQKQTLPNFYSKFIICWISCVFHQRPSNLMIMNVHVSQRQAYITCALYYQPHIHLYQEVGLKS